MGTQSLISSTSLIQTPGVIVKIGKYEFGAYTKVKGQTTYPNYIESLQITKINGQVNQYRLVLNYLITEYNDPNYFEKVFSSVAESRDIEFTYGDMSLPNYVFRNEKAMITKVDTSFAMDSAKIRYTVEAVSTGSLAGVGSFKFQATTEKVKPSKIIYDILEQNTKYGLQNLFTGMRDINLCKQKKLIATNDLPVVLETKINISILDYLQYLVNSMKSEPTQNEKDGLKNSFYVLQFCDDTTETLGGPYFKVVEVNRKVNHPEAYVLDIGYPNTTCVFDFQVENDQNYAIYYNYVNELCPQQYVTKLLPSGDYVQSYAPLYNENKYNQMTEAEKSWWLKVTAYPLKASLRLKGLLKPSLLMSYVRLNVLFFGNKHIASGLYMITKQIDQVDANGFTTTLNLVKIAEDDSGQIF